MPTRSVRSSLPLLLASALVALATGCSVQADAQTDSEDEPTLESASLALSSGGDELTAAARGPRRNGFRVAWVGAHPDDELFYAPIGGLFGNELRTNLAFILATRGEATTNCNIPGGCADIGAVREGEMRAAAAVIQGRQADVRFLGLPDGSNGFEPTRDPAVVVRNWAAASGGFNKLVAKFRNALEATGADVVVAQDPRHGDTCHPDHRATGYVLLHALKSMGRKAPPVFVAAGRLQFPPEGLGLVPLVPNDPRVFFFDANLTAPRLGGTFWDYTLGSHAQHASQTDPGFLYLLSIAPPPNRKIPMQRLDGFPASTAYDVCPIPFGHGPNDWR